MPRFSQLTVTTLALALSLFLSSLTGASAQATGIDDLPDCAKDCARTSATAAGCGLTDVACLCSKPSFSTATQQCVIPVCGFGDRSTVSGVLREMCENSTPPQSTASSSASTATRPSASASASSSSGAAPAPNPASTTAAGTTTSGRTTAPNTTTGTTTSPLSPNTTLGVGGVTNTRSSTPTSASDSSTTLVVATVVLPQSTASGAAGSLKFDAGTGLVGALLAALMGGLVL